MPCGTLAQPTASAHLRRLGEVRARRAIPTYSETVSSWDVRRWLRAVENVKAYSILLFFGVALLAVGDLTARIIGAVFVAACIGVWLPMITRLLRRCVRD